jgi:hypothetical protein
MEINMTNSISWYQRNQMVMHEEANLRAARNAMNFWATQNNYDQVLGWGEEGCICLDKLAMLEGRK